jgi:hypothetical protein
LGEAVAVGAVGQQHVRVQQPVDGRGGERLGHELVKAGRMEV